MVRKNRPQHHQQQRRGRNAFKRSDLMRAMRAAHDSDVSVKAVNVHKDGGFTLVIGKGNDGTDIDTGDDLRKLL